MIELENHHPGDGLERRKISLAPNVRLADAIDIDFESLAWQDEANCRSSNQEVFFVERGASTKQAKAICRECVVVEQCLDYAVETIQPDGVWGGLTLAERRKVRKARRQNRKDDSEKEKQSA